MEIGVFILWSITCYSLGIALAPRLHNLVNKRHRNKPLVIKGVDKPQNQLVDHYTVDDLEKHKRYLEREFKSAIHWPILRQAYARDLKEVLQTLEWHYDTDGSRERRAEKERVQQDLRNFDEMYAAALKGVKA